MRGMPTPKPTPSPTVIVLFDPPLLEASAAIVGDWVDGRVAPAFSVEVDVAAVGVAVDDTAGVACPPPPTLTTASVLVVTADSSVFCACTLEPSDFVVDA